MSYDNSSSFGPTRVGGSRATARLVVRQGPLNGQQFSLDRPSLIVGRAPDCDIVLDDPEVSRNHSRFFWRNDQLYVEDLGSANGTLINGRPIVGPHLLSAADSLEIGASLLAVPGLSAVPGSQPNPVVPASYSPAPQSLPFTPQAAPRKNNTVLWILGGLLVVALLLLAAGVAAFFLMNRQPAGTPPQVAIISPANGTQVMLNTPTTVQATATDEQGVLRVELWVDGLLVGQQPSVAPQGDPLLLLNLPWTPTIPGSHVLEVRAFNVNNVQSNTTLVTINALDTTTGAAAVAPATEAAVVASPTATPEPVQPLATATPVTGSDTVPVATATSSPSPTPEPLLQVLSGVNVRLGPGTVYDIIGALNGGDVVRPLGRSPDGGWWQIVYPPNSGGVGWVAGAYVQPNPPALNLPVVAAPPPPTGTPTATASPTASPSATSRPTATPTATGTPPSANISFTADDTSLLPGQCTTLRWQVRNIKAYWIDDVAGVGDVGSKQICDPLGVTTHTLRVQKADDSLVEYTVTVTVSSVSIPPPNLLVPENNKQFDYYPREVTFVWEPVAAAGTVQYTLLIEVDTGTWQTWETVVTGSTSYTMDNFAGANPGRWRVWVSSSAQGDGEKSVWRYFEFLR